MLKKIKLNKRNKKGQIDFGPAVLVSVIIGLLLFAPIMIRIIGTVTGTFFNTMNDTAPAAVADASSAVDKVYNFFDYLIVIAMFMNIIVLFISAWFIDTNPLFIILYIMFAFVFILFIPNMLDAVDRVWDQTDTLAASDTWEGNSLNLTFTDFIRSNMVMFTLIIIVLTGIITYAKFKLASGGFG